MKRTGLVIIFLFIAGVLLFAGGTKEEAEVNEFIIAAPGEPQNLAAQGVYKEINAVGLRNVIETLIAADPISGVNIPVLASSWRWLDDRSIEFTIRDGVTFHDGTPMTAEAVAHMVSYVWDPANAFTIQEFSGPGRTSAKATGDRTVVVSNEQADPLLEFRMTLTGITSMKQVLENPSAHYDTPIGTGPYKFKEWRQGQYWSAERYDDWWGYTADDAYGSTKPLFESIKVVFRSEDSSRVAMAETSEAHLVMYPTAEQFNAAERARNYYGVSFASDSYLYGRLDHSPFGTETLRDPRVREAIFVAIDYDALVDILGLASVPQGQLGPRGTVGFNSQLSQYQYDPERAKQLVAEAKADGVDVDNFVLQMTVRDTTSRGGIILEAINYMLSEVGIKSTVAVQEPSVFNPPFRVSDWAQNPNRDLLAVHVKSNPSSDFGTVLLSNYATPDLHDPAGPSRSSVYSNAEFDQKLYHAMTLTGNERDKALQACNKMVYENFAIIPLALYDQAYLVNNKFSFLTGSDHRIQVVFIDYKN